MVKKILPLALLLISIALCILFAFMLADEANASLVDAEPYLSAPKITEERDMSSFEKKIVWMHGSLVPAGGQTLLRAPYSDAACLYYHYEKRQGYWETDSEGDEYLAWTTVGSETKTVDTVLRTVTMTTRIDGARAVYNGLEKSADIYRTIDEARFNFVEYIVPVENDAWVIGRLENGEILGSDNGLLVYLSSITAIVRDYKTDFVILLYFIVFAVLAAAFFLCLFLTVLLRKAIPVPKVPDILFFFSTAGFVWITTGSTLASFSAEIDGIIAGIIMELIFCSVILPTLIGYACNGKRSVFVLLFIPCIGMAVLGGVFFNSAFFSVTDSLLPLLLAISCSVCAVAFVLLCRFLSSKSV